MLERCISLEPEFLPAYLELIKMRPGFGAGKLLRDIVRLNTDDQDRIVQYGFWLLENSKIIVILIEIFCGIIILVFSLKDFIIGAMQQFRNSFIIKETHALSFVGACRSLRRMGQHSRLHQIILRYFILDYILYYIRTKKLFFFFTIN